MEKLDYVGTDGWLRCGECHEPLGSGDFENPSEYGVQACHSEGCFKNADAAVEAQAAR
jgi:hypothetical protein